jgi:hypothetical protein
MMMSSPNSRNKREEWILLSSGQQGQQNEGEEPHILF